MKIKLTKQVIDKASIKEVPVWEEGTLTTQPYQGKQDTYILFDTVTDGFGIRIGGRSKHFIVQKRFGQKVHKHSIGKYGETTLDKARDVAKEYLYKISQGIDPTTQKNQRKQDQAWTVQSIIEEYRDSKTRSPNTLRDINQVIARLDDMSKLTFGKVTRELILNKFQEFGKQGPTQANRIFRYLRAAFNHHIDVHRDEGIVNPVNILSKRKAWFRVSPRTRTIHQNPDDLGAWIRAVFDLRKIAPIYGDYFLLTLLTGARRSETAELLWANVNFTARTLKFVDTKNGSEHILPMGDFTCALLANRKELSDANSPWVFPSRYATDNHMSEVQKRVLELREKSGVPFSLHDLRRTYSTILNNDLAVSSITLKFAMNHKMADVTANYVQQKIQALKPVMQAYEKHLLKSAGITNYLEIL
jgi:integrase